MAYNHHASLVIEVGIGHARAVDLRILQVNDHGTKSFVDLKIEGHYKVAHSVIQQTLFMPKTLRVGMIGYRFMGKAHSNAWRQAAHFFPLPADITLHTICGRDAEAVKSARDQLGWENASTDWRAVIAS